MLDSNFMLVFALHTKTLAHDMLPLKLVSYIRFRWKSETLLLILWFFFFLSFFFFKFLFTKEKGD